MLFTLLLVLSIQAFTTLAITYFAITPLDSIKDTNRLEVPYNWVASYVSDYIIHKSCNASQTNELRSGLYDAVKMAQHAKSHILVHGAKSPIYEKYFGAGPTGAVTGWYDKIASANRAGIVFRCDDPDRNCATQDQWAGHWRGNNASSETVICERSFLTRLPLEALCTRGFTVATGRLNSYWGSDLIHRLFHVIGEDAIHHHSHGYQGALELARGENYKLAASNSDSLIYFAVESYAYDISVPGVGCPGWQAQPLEGHHHAKVSVASNAHKSKDTDKDCHSHADGSIHCVSDDYQGDKRRGYH